MVFIDSGAFIARYLFKDQYHKQAQLLWEKLKNTPGKYYTSNFVLNEVFTFIGRNAGNIFIAECAEKIYASDSIIILRPDEKDELKALEFFRKYNDQKVSFTDCISFALMNKYGITRVFTFDNHFRIPGFNIFHD